MNNDRQNYDKSVFATVTPTKLEGDDVEKIAFHTHETEEEWIEASETKILWEMV